MATPAEIKTRNASAQSDILRQLTDTSGQVNTTASAAVNKILNEQFGQRNALIERRVGRQENIAKLNQEYVARTRNVLNAKTLDFLIEHSNIDAPTLTSIFAGYELARASEADKLNEERQFEVDRINNRDAIDQQAQALADERFRSRIDNINADRDRVNTQNQAVATSIGQAAQRDLQAQQRLDELDVRADREDARAAANNASAERRTQVTANASANRRTNSQASNLAFILSNTPQGEVPQPGTQDEQSPAQQVQGTIPEGEIPLGSARGNAEAALIEDDVQTEDQQPEEAAPIDIDGLRESKTTLIDTLIKDPTNRSALDQLTAIDGQLELSEGERQLSSTIQTLSAVGDVLNNVPEDEQALAALDRLTTQATEQAFQLTPEYNAQQVQQQAQDRVAAEEATRSSEVEVLTASLNDIEQILGNDAIPDTAKQGAVQAKVAAEQRLEELAKLAEA